MVIGFKCAYKILKSNKFKKLSADYKIMYKKEDQKTQPSQFLTPLVREDTNQNIESYIF